MRGQVWEHVLEELPAWRQLCLSTSEAAWSEIGRSEVLSAALDLASESAELDSRRRIAILGARALRLSVGPQWQAVQEELESEHQVAEAVLAGIRKPLIRMVACGACVLWPEERF